MKTPTTICGLISGLLLLAASSTSAAVVVTTDSFGSGANAFTIDFASVGNAGNANDAGAGGGSYSSSYGGVSYDYRMGVTEVPQDWITKATASGLANVTAGAWSGNQPAANMTWYEAATFVNWLNTSTGHQAAYQLTVGPALLTPWSSDQAWQLNGENLYRHKDAYYFLPSDNEWYKAAYHQNDGVTANYWDYATGSNTIPTPIVSGTGTGTAVYSGVTVSPADVDNNGALSPYGTMGQNGNVSEWQESAYDGINDGLPSLSEFRALRGGSWQNPEESLRASDRNDHAPSDSGYDMGFRVASVAPEPSRVMLMLAGASIMLLRRRRILAGM